MTRECYVCIGFDGTCVTNNYPNVGEDVGADLWLKAAVGMGAKLILYTMRSQEGLEEAVAWFNNHRVPLWSVNDNPSQESWSASRKVHRHITVDDSGLCMPVKRHGTRERWVVDWDEAGPFLLKKIAGILNQ
jgi:hypothetical protein